MNAKTKKIWNVVANVVVIVILVFVAIITLNIILSRDKGYTPLFGNTFVAVQSDSMNGAKPEGEDFADKPSGFKKGDLIKVKLMSDVKLSDFKVGDVITFYATINGKKELNTHRIMKLGDNETSTFVYTQGDNREMSPSTERTYLTDVIGKYTGTDLKGLGNVVDFFHSSAGFFVMVVIPSLIVVAYFTTNLVLTVKKAKAEDKSANEASEKERMRQELLEELRKEGKITADAEEKQTETENDGAEKVASEENTAAAEKSEPDKE